MFMHGDDCVAKHQVKRKTIRENLNAIDNVSEWRIANGE
jgi:hypothetical protein